MARRRANQKETADIIPPSEDDEPAEITREEMAEVDVEIPLEEAKRRTALDAKSVGLNRRIRAGINRRRMGDKNVKWQGSPEDAYEGVSYAFGSTQAFVQLKRMLPSFADLGTFHLGSYETWPEFDKMVREKFWTGEDETYEWSIRQRGDYRATGKFTLGENPDRKIVWARKSAEARAAAVGVSVVDQQQQAVAAAADQKIESIRQSVEALGEAVKTIAQQRSEPPSPTRPRPSFEDGPLSMEEEEEESGTEEEPPWEESEDMHPMHRRMMGPPPPPEPTMFYFAIQGSGTATPQGPLDARSLCQQIYREMGGQSLPLVTVWAEGWPSWKPASSIQEIVATFHTIVPPPVVPPAAPPWAAPPMQQIASPFQQQREREREREPEPLPPPATSQQMQQQGQQSFSSGNERALIEALIKSTRDNSQVTSYLASMQQQMQQQAAQTQQTQQQLAETLAHIQSGMVSQPMMGGGGGMHQQQMQMQPQPNPAQLQQMQQQQAPPPASMPQAQPAAVVVQPQQQSAAPDVLHQAADTIDAVEKIARKLGLGRAVPVAAPAALPMAPTGPAPNPLGGLGAMFPKEGEATAALAVAEAAAEESDPIKVIEGGPWRMAYYRKTGQPVSFLESMFLNMDNLGEMLGKVGDRVEKARMAMAEGEMAQRRKLMLDRAMQKIDETEKALAEKEEQLEEERARAQQLEAHHRMLAQQNPPTASPPPATPFPPVVTRQPERPAPTVEPEQRQPAYASWQPSQPDPAPASPAPAVPGSLSTSMRGIGF